MNTMKRISVFIALLLISFACEKDKDFAWDMDLLIGTQWGIPQVTEGSYSMAAPTIFYEDGTVTFGGSITDLWEVRDSRSLYIQRRAEIWQVIQLTESRLVVDILEYPQGNFKASCTYEPLQ